MFTFTGLGTPTRARHNHQSQSPVGGNSQFYNAGGSAPYGSPPNNTGGGDIALQYAANNFRASSYAGTCLKNWWLESVRLESVGLLTEWVRSLQILLRWIRVTFCRGLSVGLETVRHTLICWS